jgi:thiazole/oxazole-forming peptide maturase SagD family component
MLSPHARVSGDSLHLSGARGERRVDAPRALLHDIAATADGRTPVAEWLNALSVRWARADLEPLVAHLVEQAFLVPVKALPAALWQYVSNPRRLGAQPEDAHVARLVEQAAVRTIQHDTAPTSIRLMPDTTWLTSALSTRRSNRRFGAGRIEAERIAALLWAGYGACAPALDDAAATRLVRTVPSAGALYPLDLYFLNMRAVDGLAAGAYRATFGADGSVQFEPWLGDIDSIARAFGDPSLIEDAQGIVVIAGDFALSAEKYGPRALSYVALEAGHVAQNVLLQAQAFELAAVEVGGFIEDALARAAGIESNRMPLTTIVFGTRESGGDETRNSNVQGRRTRVPDAITERVPANGCTFEWLDFDTDAYRLPFAIGQARIGAAGDWSWGRDRHATRAWLKAIMEAHERRACDRLPSGKAPTDARIDEWPDALVPDSLTRYAAHQLSQDSFPFGAFTPSQRYEWVEGADVRTGKPVAVTVDHVYYPAALRSGRKRLAAATSSGVAAHGNRGEALARAVLETIERDAFMRAWLERRPLPALDIASLPGDIRARIAALNDAGVCVWVRALDVAPAVGVFVAAQCVDRHFTRVASAASCDAHDALDHALMELEAAVAATFALAPQPPIAPADVLTSQDHARLYTQRRYFRRADWFIAAPGETRDFRSLKASATTSDAIVEQSIALRPRIVAIDLRHADASGPHVVRALMPGCIPLTFGYGLEPEGMVGQRTRRGAAALFPHPFT